MNEVTVNVSESLKVTTLHYINITSRLKVKLCLRETEADPGLTNTVQKRRNVGKKKMIN